MHWRFKTVDPTLIVISPFPSGLWPLCKPSWSILLLRGLLSVLLLLQLFVSSATALCGEVMVLNNLLFVPAIPPLFNLALFCDSRILLCSYESDSLFCVAWLVMSTGCVLFFLEERCSCRVLHCPSISWGFFCCQWLRLW